MLKFYVSTCDPASSVAKRHDCGFTNGSQIKQFIWLCAVCDPNVWISELLENKRPVQSSIADLKALSLPGVAEKAQEKVDAWEREQKEKETKEKLENLDNDLPFLGRFPSL
ncbi:hypothetical protein IPF86_03435 [Candidatus Nomurabacteria bacterium]|nr:MAG: hypothetical protein IPF86_03435 [Candidatus Nomurabacteria bacterium]